MSDLPRIWEDPAGFFAESAPSGRRPDELAAGCIEYIEQGRAHPPRLRRSPGIVRVVAALEVWGADHLGDLNETGVEALRDVLERLTPFANHALEDLTARVRARGDLLRLRRIGRPDERLVALCEAVIAGRTKADLEELHDRFSPIDQELRGGLLELETRYPDLAELAVPPFEELVQRYAITRASGVRKVRRGALVGAIGLTVVTFVVRCQQIF